VPQSFNRVDERVASNKIRYKINELSQMNEIYIKWRAKRAEFNDLIQISIFKFQGLESVFQNAPSAVPGHPTTFQSTNIEVCAPRTITGITSALTGPTALGPGVNGAAVNQRRQIANSSRRADHRRALSSTPHH
jgi:hypothetical protein